MCEVMRAEAESAIEVAKEVICWIIGGELEEFEGEE